MVAARYANRQDLRRTVPIEAIIMRHAFITTPLRETPIDRHGDYPWRRSGNLGGVWHDLIIRL